MKLYSVDFEYGEARRNSTAAPASFNNNIEILSATGKEDTLTLQFRYTATYSPDESKLLLGGTAKFMFPHADKLAAEFAANKRIGGVNGEMILNSLNYHCSLNSVMLSRVFNLVPPIMLPTLKFEEPKKK
jgi:hypothetical protein